MVDNKRSDKEHVEPVNPSFTILDSKLESLKFLFASLPLTPHQIGIRQEVILIPSTSHASEVFTTPIATLKTHPIDRRL